MLGRLANIDRYVLGVIRTADQILYFPITSSAVQELEGRFPVDRLVNFRWTRRL